MRYNNISAFEKHLKESAPNHLAELYLLLHYDSFSLQQLISRAMKYFEDSSWARFDSSVTPKMLLNELQQLPFLKSSQVVIVSDVENLQKVTQEAIVNYLESPNPASHLILTGCKLAKNTRLYKKSEKAGVILQIIEEKPWEREESLRQEVYAQFKERGITITPDALALLIQRSDANTAQLFQEKEKILTYIGSRTQITIADIEALIPKESKETIWQLGDAVLSKNFPLAHQLAHSLYLQEPAIIAHLRPLRYQVEMILEIASMIEKGQNAQIQEKFPQLRGKRLQTQLNYARTLGSHKLESALIQIDETELRAKNSNILPKHLWEQLMIQLCQ
ncbi:MAG: DNA polymerase III subunit delta [Waddliaceae bacterium]